MVSDWKTLDLISSHAEKLPPRFDTEAFQRQVFPNVQGDHFKAIRSR